MVLNTSLRLAQNKIGLEFGEKIILSVFQLTVLKYYIEVHSEPIQTSKMEFFTKIVPD